MKKMSNEARLLSNKAWWGICIRNDCPCMRQKAEERHDNIATWDGPDAEEEL